MDDVDPLALALEAIPKALVYGAVILSIGVVAARQLFANRVAATLPQLPLDRSASVSFSDSLSAPASGSGTGDHRHQLFERDLARLSLAAAVLLLVGLLLRAWGHTAVSFGLAESFTGENLRTIAWESQWGEAWKLQMAGAASLLVCAWAIGQTGAIGWTLTAVAAVAMCVLLTLIGHAGGEPPKMLLHASHIFGGGLWIGTLMAMAIATRGELRDALLRAFAPFAFAGSALLALTGAIAAWLYVGTMTNLATTPYGWALILKLVFVADVATFGFLNWRRFHSSAGTSVSRQGRPTIASVVASRTNPDIFVFIEVVMAVAVIVVTAILTELEHPG